MRQKLAAELKLPTGYFLDVGGRVESQERAAQSLAVAIAVAILAVFVLLYLALDSLAEALVILATLPDAFVGGILALLIAGETWNVSVARGPDRPVRHRRPERPGAGRADARICSPRASPSPRPCARRASAACGPS